MHSQHSAPPRDLPFKKKSPNTTLKRHRWCFCRCFEQDAEVVMETCPSSSLAHSSSCPGRVLSASSAGEGLVSNGTNPVPGCHQQGHSVLLCLPKQHNPRKDHSKGIWESTQRAQSLIGWKKALRPWSPSWMSPSATSSWLWDPSRAEGSTSASAQHSFPWRYFPWYPTWTSSGHTCRILFSAVLTHR